ncbi:class I SAM-dependent methyltransferase [Ruicaihuangia caeni]|uniref:class I SAM-dependent methyltransferase n=1 Tax=Ruicaihuangia caeni TaxID=3042517 RepID=UPI00338D881B
MATSRQWQLEHDSAVQSERYSVPAIFGPFADALLERASISPGDRVLDIGCGTGAATRPIARLAGESGQVVGVDVNQASLEVAASVSPTDGAMIEWVEADAEHLPFDDGSFDVVVMAQTLQFLPDRAAALREARRVLRSGGRLVASFWASTHSNPYFEALTSALLRLIDDTTARGVASVFALAKPEPAVESAEEAGFSSIRLEQVTLRLDLTPVAQFLPQHMAGTPMARGWSAASDSARAHVVEQVTEAIARFGPQVPFCSHVLVATA